MCPTIQGVIRQVILIWPVWITSLITPELYMSSICNHKYDLDQKCSTQSSIITCFLSSCYMSFFLTVILARSLNFLSWCNLVSKLKTFVMKLWGSGSAYKEHVDFYTHAICWSIMKCIIDFVWQYTLKLIRERTAVRYDIIAVAFVSFKVRCQKVAWLWFKWIYWCLWLFFSHKCSIAIVKVLNTLINQSFSLWYRIN